MGRTTHSGLVFNIQRYSLQDGPGIRTTIFLKGCRLRCWWCHNPESQASQAELSFFPNRCTQCGICGTVCPKGKAAGNGQQTAGASDGCTRCGACAAACPSQARQMIGCRMTVDEVLAEALKDRIFYDDSGGGVTFSGGEPLDQPAFLLALLQACRRQGLHTAVDTSGYAAEEDLLAIAVLTDLFLYDLKVIDDRRHREWTGVSNKLILKNLQALGQAHARIWIRVPIIPGCNDDREQLQAIARVAASIPGVVQLNLLPYHPAGIHKRASLGQPQPPPAVGPVAAESLAQAAQSLRLPGLSIQIGG